MLEQLMGTFDRLAAESSASRVELNALRAALTEFEGRFAADRARSSADLASVRTMLEDIDRSVGHGRGPTSRARHTDG